MKGNRNNVRMDYLSRLLPGDHIHHVAPTSSKSAPTAARISNIDAANAKRARKNAKRQGKTT